MTYEELRSFVVPKQQLIALSPRWHGGHSVGGDAEGPPPMISINLSILVLISSSAHGSYERIVRRSAELSRSSKPLTVALIPDSMEMDAQTRRYIKFNGYLIFAFTLVIVFYETWSLTIDTLYANQQYLVFNENILIRRNLTGRWVTAVIWLVALAAYFMAMHWEDAEFLTPAIILYAAEVLLLLAEDLMRTLKDDGNERFITNGQNLFFFSVLVAYVMYTLHTLKVMFRRSSLKEKSMQYKVNLINCSSGSYAV